MSDITQPRNRIVPPPKNSAPLPQSSQLAEAHIAFKTQERIKRLLTLTIELDRVNQLIIANKAYFSRIDLTELINVRKSLLNDLQHEMNLPRELR